MPAAAASPSGTTGHPPYPPTSSNVGSNDVLINDQPALREGDLFLPHGDTKIGSPVAKGSATVFINNKPAARIGDPIACGDTIAVASKNVIFGG